MSKPEMAFELPTPSDLTMEACVRTVDLLLKQSETFPDDMALAIYELRVPSQSLPLAAQITALAAVDMSVVLDCEYHPDEWSLKLTAIDGDSGGGNSVTEIWSPGA